MLSSVLMHKVQCKVQHPTLTPKLSGFGMARSCMQPPDLTSWAAHRGGLSVLCGLVVLARSPQPPTAWTPLHMGGGSSTVHAAARAMAID